MAVLASVATQLLVACSSRLCADSSDAGLNEIVANSPDSIWAVGERATVLNSMDGGRSWKRTSVSSTGHFFDIVFDSERTGWIVGGEIRPYSHTSQGYVLVTDDAGRTWMRIETPTLPRLLGIHSFGSGHLLAWGDWSTVLESGLFETMDGGRTWNAKSLRATHIQCAAWSSPDDGLVVDRLSRVFRVQPGREPALLPIAGDPTSPIVDAAISEDGWWLIGAHGQIYWSPDGNEWVRRSLPGTAEDHRCISLKKISSLERSTWIAGSPGNVIWATDDQGTSWQVYSLPTSLPNRCLAAINRDTIFVGGTAGSLLATRNRARAWWPVHGQASRVAACGIAARLGTVPWDLLTYLSNESRAQCAAIAIHSERLHERLDYFVEQESRGAQVAAELQIASFEQSPHFPIRSEAKTLNPSNASPQSPIVRHLVTSIRTLRPELIVSPDPASLDANDRALAEAVREARHLATDSSYRCFSAQSNIPETPWNCSRIVAPITAANDSRNSRSNQSIAFAATTALAKSGKLLASDIDRTTRLLERSWERNFTASVPSLNRYHSYRFLTAVQSSPDKDNLLPDAAFQVDCQRTEPTPRSTTYQGLLSQSQQLSFHDELMAYPGPKQGKDVRWETALRTWVSILAGTHREESLWKLAEGYRLRGYWNRWQITLEAIIAESPRSGAAELAFLELARFQSSAEVQLLRKNEQGHHSIEGSPTRQPQEATREVSPFSSDATAIQFASANLETKSEPVENSIPKSYRRYSSQFAHLRSDPRLLLSTIDAPQATSGVSDENPRSPRQRLQDFRASLIWERVSDQERSIASASHAIHDLNSVSNRRRDWTLHAPRVSDRPRLDGKIDEQLWRSSLSLTLSESVPRIDSQATVVHICQDDSFVYLAAQCPKNTVARKAATPVSDKINFYFDIDRDYATWFCLSIDAAGETDEFCVDMNHWQPRYYVQRLQDTKLWCLELAIAKSDIQGDPRTSPTDRHPDQWNLMIERVSPDRDYETLLPFVFDSFDPTTFIPLTLDD